MKKIIFSNQETNDIMNEYLKNFSSTRKIAEKYNVSKTVITRILKENNIELRKDNRKYFCNQDSFEEINTKEKAYWLGFIAADGCNYQREQNASIIINIQQKDYNHLEKFKNFLNTNANIIKYTSNEGYSNNSSMCKIIINSKKMSKDLYDKGIVPRKSLILKPPIIKEKYNLPFILGYFDGDGSIYKTKQNEFNISIEGTKQLLEWINNILHISSKLEKRYNDNKNNYYIRCGGINKPYQIMKQLYNSTDIHLDRKYNIYKTLELVVLNRNIK